VKRIAAGAAFLGLALLATASVATADQVYRTEHLPLSPVGDAPLKSGFVNNIHPNGPQVYAKEVYSLKGAEPNAEYTVMLHGYLGSTACEGTADLEIPTAVLTTNVAGNGKASIKFTPDDVEELRGLTIGVRWTVNDANGPAYETACTTVVLD
jgi:hypothetical protein